MTTVAVVGAIYVVLAVALFVAGRVAEAKRRMDEQAAGHARVAAAFHAEAARAAQNGHVPHDDAPRHPPALPPMH